MPLRIPRRSLQLPAPATGPRVLWWVVRSQAWPLAIGIAAGVAWMGSLAVMPALLGVAVDEGVATGSVPAMVPWAVAVVAVSLGGDVLGALRHWFAVRLYVDTKRMLTERIADRVLDPGGGLDAALGPGEVVSHADADTERVGDDNHADRTNRMVAMSVRPRTLSGASLRPVPAEQQRGDDADDGRGAGVHGHRTAIPCGCRRAAVAPDAEVHQVRGVTLYADEADGDLRSVEGEAA